MTTKKPAPKPTPDERKPKKALVPDPPPLDVREDVRHVVIDAGFVVSDRINGINQPTACHCCGNVRVPPCPTCGN